MTSGAFVPDSVAKDIISIKKKLKQLSDNNIYAPPQNDLSTIFASLGQRNAAHGPTTGPDVVQPIRHFITDVNASGVHTGVFDKMVILASNIIVDQTATTNITLKSILKTQNDGQRISALTVAAGKTLTLEPGDNLAIPSNIVMSDQDVAYLVYSQDIGNKYRVLLAKAGGGSNLWSGISIDVDKDMGTHGLLNLSLITFLNSDGKLRQVSATQGTGIIFDLGTTLNPLSSEGYFYKISGIEVLRIKSTPTARLDLENSELFNASTIKFPNGINGSFDSTIPMMTVDSLGNLYFNAPTTSSTKRLYRFQNAGVDSVVFDMQDNLLISYLQTIEIIPPTGHSWSVIKTGGAPALYIATDGHEFDSVILANATNSIDIGTITTYFRTLNALEWKMPAGITASLDPTKPMIFPVNSDMKFNVPSGNVFRLLFNGTDTIDIDSSQIAAKNLVLTSYLTINNSGLNPLANGMMSLNGSNLLAMSGGVTINFTQIPQLNAFNTWSGTNLFNAGVEIKTTFFLVLNQNDTGDTYVRQSSNPGTVPKVLDIACFSDVVFKAYGETSTSLSRGLIKGMQQSGDPSTSQIPSGYFGVNKNTSTGAVKVWYNDGGIMKSATLA